VTRPASLRTAALRRTRPLWIALLVVAGACHHEFNPRAYTNPEALFNVGLREYNAHHWDNATKAFDQLTRDLPARDPLLPLSYYYLGKSQDQSGDHLLAAQSFSRIADAFPEDSLAPRAMYEGAVAYTKMWHRPELDPQYGQQAMTALQTMIALYPDSPLIPKANETMAKLDAMFAQKDYAIAHQYFKRGAYDSAIIYYKDVIQLHPNAPAARTSALELYDAYRIIKYTDDAKDLCDATLKKYPTDQAVRAKCGSVSSAAASTPHT